YDTSQMTVPFGTKQLDAVLSVPASAKDTSTAVLLTHGAGGDMNLKHLVSLAHTLASNGFLSLRFTCKGLNLSYRVKAYHAVYYFKSIILNVFYINRCDPSTGRSMGCRAAAALARQLNEEKEGTVQGVICLSFPLHPPRQTHSHRQRSEDLRRLPEHTSVLFVLGTEDNMCDRDLFDGMVKELKAQVEVFWLEGGSHGLTVKGRSDDSVLDEINLHVITWIRKQGA
uniref:KANL3/Tex30 alpha/beta hydrolase-like domain-containing protein n=1 Tax=Monopterus albus TaxID=43700 RepID=A0A3Q3JZW3_MONAL